MGKKEKIIGLGEKKIGGRSEPREGKASEASLRRPSPGHRSVHFAFLFDSVFCLFPLTAECGPPRLVVSESRLQDQLAHF